MPFWGGGSPKKRHSGSCFFVFFPKIWAVSIDRSVDFASMDDGIGTSENRALNSACIFPKAFQGPRQPVFFPRLFRFSGALAATSGTVVATVTNFVKFRGAAGAGCGAAGAPDVAGPQRRSAHRIEQRTSRRSSGGDGRERSAGGGGGWLGVACGWEVWGLVEFVDWVTSTSPELAPLFLRFFLLFWGFLYFPRTKQKNSFFAGVLIPAKKMGLDHFRGQLFFRKSSRCGSELVICPWGQQLGMAEVPPCNQEPSKESSSNTLLLVRYPDPTEGPLVQL